MTDEESRDRIFRVVKERIKEAGEKERIQMLTNAIGDRRYRDLVDIVAKVEGEDGWSTVLDYLMKAQNLKYSSPLTFGKDKTNLEELKYREMIFELLSCRGFEPIALDTISLLKELDDTSSLVDASNTLIKRLEHLAIEQVQAGDTLFFDFSENISVSQESVNLLARVRNENIQNISLKQSGTQFKIEPLWYSEYGRLSLSNLGVKGYFVNANMLDMVLSGIQVPHIIKSRIEKVTSFKDTEDLWNRPANLVYRKLHACLIQHKVREISLLGSRHATPLLNVLLDTVSATYDDQSSATDYRKILEIINAHITIRDIESVLVLEKSSQMKNERIETAAVLAIGNFYHESSASTLVKLLCNKKSSPILKVLTKAIENVYRKCPEADYVIASSLDMECRNRGKLKKLYRQLSKERPLYYQ